MTTERMQEIADLIVLELDMIDAAEFVHVLRVTIESHGYSLTELEILDAAFLANGIDVGPICRSKHPA